MRKYIPKSDDVEAVVGFVLVGGKRVAVCFSGDFKSRVRATRKFFGRDARFRMTDIVLTIGPPNYAEREYLRLCKKAKAKPRRFWFPK